MQHFQGMSNHQMLFQALNAAKLTQYLKINNFETRQQLKLLHIYLPLPRKQKSQPASQSHEFWTPPSVRTPS